MIKYIKYVFASKSIHAVYLNPNLQKYSSIQPIWKVHLNNELILDRFWHTYLIIELCISNTHVLALERPRLSLLNTLELKDWCWNVNSGALTHSVKALDISLNVDTELAVEVGKRTKRAWHCSCLYSDFLRHQYLSLKQGDNFHLHTRHLGGQRSYWLPNNCHSKEHIILHQI